jgi:hypothetical protein
MASTGAQESMLTDAGAAHLAANLDKPTLWNGWEPGNKSRPYPSQRARHYTARMSALQPERGTRLAATIGLFARPGDLVSSEVCHASSPESVHEFNRVEGWSVDRCQQPKCNSLRNIALAEAEQERIKLHDSQGVAARRWVAACNNER